MPITPGSSASATAPNSRIYYTADGGTNWTLQFTNQDPDAFYDCFGFWDAQRGIAVGDAVKGHTGILTTDDGGLHWNPTPPATTPTAPDGEGSYAASGTCLVTGPPVRVWIVAADSIRSRVILSGDYGRTWGSVTLPLTTRAGAGAAVHRLSRRQARHGVRRRHHREAGRRERRYSPPTAASPGRSAASFP